MLKVEGFDDCIIGIAQIWDKEHPVVVYDSGEMIEVLIAEHNMSREEAVEYFEFNIQGAYLGEYTPLYVARCNPDVVIDLLH